MLLKGLLGLFEVDRVATVGQKDHLKDVLENLVHPLLKLLLFVHVSHACVAQTDMLLIICCCCCCCSYLHFQKKSHYSSDSSIFWFLPCL